MASILAVDDSTSMRQMVSFTLKGAGYDVVEAGELPYAVPESVPRLRPGVRLVPPHDPRPLLGRHRSRAGVREQVDQDVVRRDTEQVPVRLLQDLPTLLPAGHAQRLDRLDPKGLEDPGHAVAISSEIPGAFGRLGVLQERDVSEAAGRAHAHNRA